MLTPTPKLFQLHPYCQQRTIVDYCKEKGIVIEAYSPLVRGKLGDDAIKEIAATKVSSRLELGELACSCIDRVP